MQNWKLLIITAIDIANRRLAPNQRVHHVIRSLATRCPQVTVLYNSMAPFEKQWSLLKRLVYIRDLEKAVIWQDSNIRYIEVHTNFFRFWHSAIHSTTGPALTFLHGLLRDSSVFDVAVASTPWAGIVALWLKRLGRVRAVVYEDYDFFPGFYINQPNVFRAVMRIENRCIMESDAVISVGEELAALRRSFTQRPVYVVENGYEGQLFRPAASPRFDPTVLIYTGSLEHWAGVDLVIRAMPVILKQRSNAELHVIGSGPAEAEWKALVEKLGLGRRVIFLGRKPYHELSCYTANATIGICTFRPSPLTRYAFPLKIAEYMAVGLPVLGTDVGDIARIIRQSQAGCLTDGSPEDIASAVMEMLEPTHYTRLRQHALLYAERLNWERLMERQYEIIFWVCRRAT